MSDDNTEPYTVELHASKVTRNYIVYEETVPLTNTRTGGAIFYLPRNKFEKLKRPAEIEILVLPKPAEEPKK